MSIGRILGIILAMLAALFFLGVLHGCAVLDRGQAAVHVDDYKTATEACLAKGKRADSMAVFDACLHDVDAHYGLLITDGGVE